MNRSYTLDFFWKQYNLFFSSLQTYLEREEKLEISNFDLNFVKSNIL